MNLNQFRSKYVDPLTIDLFSRIFDIAPQFLFQNLMEVPKKRFGHGLRFF